MNAINAKLKKYIICLKSRYVFVQNEKELYKVLDCSQPLNCQREYLINYLLYLQSVTRPKRSLSHTESKDMIMILNCIFETGFRPIGICNSEPCSGLFSFCSEISFNKANAAKSYSELISNSEEILAVFNECKSPEIDSFDIKNQGSIFHYWQIVSSIFSEHPIIDFLNQYYNNSYCWNEKALGLFQLMDSELLLSILKSLILSKEIMCNVYDPNSSYLWNNLEGLVYIALKFKKISINSDLQSRFDKYKLADDDYFNTKSGLNNPHSITKVVFGGESEYLDKCSIVSHENDIIKDSTKDRADSNEYSNHNLDNAYYEVSLNKQTEPVRAINLKLTNADYLTEYHKQNLHSYETVNNRGINSHREESYHFEIVNEVEYPNECENHLFKTSFKTAKNVLSK